MPTLTDGRRTIHLGYGTNVHPGETLAAVAGNLRAHAAPLRRRLGLAGPMGVGLWLPDAAVREFLAEPRKREGLREALAAGGLYAFTLNAFPFAAFHGRRVKERVFRPTWLDRSRVEYTQRAAEVLAALLPDGVPGSVSTSPGSFKPFGDTPRIRFEIATNVLRVAAHLRRIRERTGKRIALAIEPEPLGTVESTWEFLAFFTDGLLSDGRHTVANDLGVSEAEAERAIREHVGVCFDACHLSVAFEDLEWSLRLLEDRGVRIAKVQLSNALAFGGGSAAALRGLRRLRGSRYLHQVAASRGPGETWRFRDVGDFLAGGAGLLRRGTEARVHFHAPLHLERLGPFRTTRPGLEATLRHLFRRGGCEHLEMETYTWPLVGRVAGRPADAMDGLEAEFRFVLGRARRYGWTPARAPGSRTRPGAPASAPAVPPAAFARPRGAG